MRQSILIIPTICSRAQLPSGKLGFEPRLSHFSIQALNNYSILSMGGKRSLDHGGIYNLLGDDKAELLRSTVVDRALCAWTVKVVEAEESEFSSRERLIGEYLGKLIGLGHKIARWGVWWHGS